MPIILWFGLFGVVLLSVSIFYFFKQRMILEVIPPLVTECLGVVMVCFAAGFERYTTLLIFIGCAFIFALFFDPLVWKRFALNKDMKFSVILNGSVCALGLIAYFVGYAISGNN